MTDDDFVVWNSSEQASFIGWLPSKSKSSLCVACVRACVCACVRACVCTYSCRPLHGGLGNTSQASYVLVFSCVNLSVCVSHSWCVVETRSRQGSPQVGVAILPDYSLLHKAKARSCTKLLYQCRNILVGYHLYCCQHIQLYAGNWACSLVEESEDHQVCYPLGAFRWVFVCLWSPKHFT